MKTLDMGVEEYLYSGNWCFIEWADKFQILSQNHIPSSPSKSFLTEDVL
jgi:tRNA A37 threonylcarbamoyladenosine biosynthesis protein TsaE